MRSFYLVPSFVLFAFLIDLGYFTTAAFAPHLTHTVSSTPTWHAVTTTRTFHYPTRVYATSDETGEDATCLLDKLQTDLEALAELRPALTSADPSSPEAIVSAGSSYTRIWTHHTWKIHSDPPHRRYLRHLRLWHKSTTARKILPAVLMATCWSILVSLLAEYLQLRPLQSAILMAGRSSAVSLLSAPLALLLTLKANASMARLLEARGAWGRLVLQARSLASIAGTYIYPVDPQAAVLVVRYLSILGWSLKAQLRGESDAYQQEYLHSMLNQMRTTEGTSSSAGANTTNVEGGESEGAWLSKQSKQSVAITTRLRKICAVALSTPPTSSMDIMNPSTQLIIEERIRELETVVGVCERLFGSTIPPTYTRHLSRVMSLWLLLLPVSLIAINLKTVGVAFATTIAAYVFIGLDEVGMEIENVFQLLPLQQLAAATQKDVQDQFFMTVRA